MQSSTSSQATSGGCGTRPWWWMHAGSRSLLEGVSLARRTFFKRGSRTARSVLAPSCFRDSTVLPAGMSGFASVATDPSRFSLRTEKRTAGRLRCCGLDVGTKRGQTSNREEILHRGASGRGLTAAIRRPCIAVSGLDNAKRGFKLLPAAKLPARVPCDPDEDLDQLPGDTAPETMPNWWEHTVPLSRFAATCRRSTCWQFRCLIAAAQDALDVLLAAAQRCWRQQSHGWAVRPATERPPLNRSHFSPGHCCVKTCCSAWTWATAHLLAAFKWARHLHPSSGM
jgi:hypothetical protein